MSIKSTSKGLKVRRLSQEEGQRLLQIVRRGVGARSHITWRRAVIVLASAGGTKVKGIANLVQTSPDRVREVIHNFNRAGMEALDPKWSGGRPRQITGEDRALIVRVAKKRPRSLGQPFTRWSLRKLQHYLATKKHRKVEVSRERLRQILSEEKITFQRNKTWKRSKDPDYEAKMARIDYVINRYPDRTFAFDEFGPLSIRPFPGSSWSERKKPLRLPANYRRTKGTRMFHGCYSVGDDTLWGVVRKAKSQRATLKALESIRAARPDGKKIYVILDNLSCHGGEMIESWCKRNNVELCFTPTNASFANPIEAHFGGLREFVMAGSNHPSHQALSKAIHDHLRWRNSNARNPELLRAERKERARLRKIAGRKWGERPKQRAA